MRIAQIQELPMGLGKPATVNQLGVGPLIWLKKVVSICACLLGNSCREVVGQSPTAPLLVAKCVKCHGPEKQKGGLRLDVKAAAFMGGDSGVPAIKAGHSAESRLLELVSSVDENERMPPDSEPLSNTQVEVLRQWIDAGANWPDADPVSSPRRSEMVVRDEDRNHWSFRKLQSVALPEISEGAWVRAPVDLLVRKTQEWKGLTPSMPADARTLIRRLYLDVIGLPPNLIQNGARLKEELLGIEIDPQALIESPDAMALLVDQLLAVR